MKYYSEDVSKELRLALEEEVLKWESVSFKKMFGCPCYEVNGGLFVFLVTKGIVLTHLEEVDKEQLQLHYESSFFRAGKKEVKDWLQVSINNVEELRSLIPFVRKSYQQAKNQSKHSK